MTCPLCQTAPLDTAGEQAMQACAECANTIGIIPMPARTRTMQRCAKCNGGKFVRAIPREHATDAANSTTNQVSRPMMLTNKPDVKPLFRWTPGTANRIQPIDLDRGYGLLEVYACMGCGFVEWYCLGVESIPIHPHLMTEMIDLDGETPYR